MRTEDMKWLHRSAVLARLGKRIPRPLLSLQLAGVLEAARLVGWLRPPAELDGRSFAITVHDLGLRHPFRCERQHFLPSWQQQVDLELCADAADFIALLQGKADADTLFFMRKLRVEGDVELGLLVKNWLDSLERPSWR
ncbi:Predicted lipid carrier protein YhbT, contains SCP2 domain [Andreprevotia lacus DSM 23236]|jgi:predicted lipid carrier protein YhbT|uniref:Predicted lipid carrier protein YhbT, contains SCP2 domain n=1 Tax=Andreprevotia lacus DSM 23236 TaxID=1121001 RepID=A0A1W1XWT5_9NEIS|nr:SCP2 sterol-binding domain-containing protein [Andreprevotia lacus]SMC28403.1 Predicted lipid carrier protein YhbT, contains SCP2 domain [Andreprevotia lacus DSM 23236]